jgi:uncharacterized membrane protein
MRRIWSIMLGLLVGVLAIGYGGSALAQGEQPQNGSSLTIFTAYPSQETAIGETVNFDLKLRASTSQIVHLSTQSVPEGWTTTFRGGGKIVQAVYVDTKEDATVTLGVEPPTSVEAGTYTFSVLAQGSQGQASLPISLLVKAKLPPNLKLDVDLPTLQGAPDTSFRYNATLKNEGDEDLTVNLSSQAPDGFQLDFQLDGKSVTSFPLAANDTKTVAIDAKALSGIPAGAYPIKVMAQGGKASAELDLEADVTGQSQLSVSSPDGRLSGEAYAGSTTPFKIVVQNTGSAPARDIKLSASPPSGWQVTFSPEQLPEVPAGQQIEVTANMQPNGQAIAGDYMVSVSATPAKGAAKSADFRITVLTSTLWGIVGVALIAVAVVVVGLAVTRFGRR